MNVAIDQSFDSAFRRPRLGFVGVGWIGLNRLQAVIEAGLGDVACIAEPSQECAIRALEAIATQGATPRCAPSFEQLLEEQLDGVVIATPSGMHASQASLALSRGLSVFCQKPLARTATEAGSVIEMARLSDRLLAVDFCYRTVAGVRELRDLAQSGVLGEIYAADLVFHNAYGPDKPWFYDLRQSGGGCVMDLGIHLADLLLWVLNYPRVTGVSSRLHANGKLLAKPVKELEDYAVAEVHFETGVTARLACSWRLSAGTDAVIEAAFYGTKGAVIFRNRNGAFYDFAVEHCEGTRRRTLAVPPDNWSGRAVCAWTRQLAINPGFDPEAQRLHDVSLLIDAIYGR